MNSTATLVECVKEAEMEDILVRLSNLETLHEDVKEIKTTVNEVKELLTTWNSIKGFGTTIKWIAAAVKIVAILGAAAAATYLFFTGHLPK